MSEPLHINGLYEHYSGRQYRLIGVAKHSETLEELIVYEPRYNNTESKLWVRPKAMFFEDVEKDGKLVPRFRYMES